MKKIIIILTVLLVVGSSCTDYLGVNEKNPNSASSVPANLVLPAALNSSARLLTTPGNFNFVYQWYGCWSISGGYSQDVNMTTYNLTNGSYQGDWSNAYLALSNYKYIEQNSTEPKLKAYVAIAKIMSAMHYGFLVDMYGNIPYSQALDPANLKPVYDPQKDVYEDLVTKLDEAMGIIDAIVPTDENPGSNDIIYGGDMSLWWKFANTLKLRLLINQSNNTSRASYITTAIATTPHAPENYIGAGEGAMLNPGYVQSTGKMNPFYERFYKQDGSQQADGLGLFVPGMDACDFLTANNDPRKYLMFTKVTIGGVDSVTGNYFATLPLRLPSVTSKLGTGMVKTYNASSPILTDFESLFLQAEAVNKGLITGDAKALYESAVTQNVIYFGSNSAAAGSYLAQVDPDVNYDAAPDKIKLIITQKWLALNGVSPMPIWNDYRRTAFPDFIHFSEDNARKNDHPPVRFLYPQSEISTNNDNVVLQGVSSVEDTFTKFIFWDPRAK